MRLLTEKTRLGKPNLRERLRIDPNNRILPQVRPADKQAGKRVLLRPLRVTVKATKTVLLGEVGLLLVVVRLVINRIVLLCGEAKVEDWVVIR